MICLTSEVAQAFNFWVFEIWDSLAGWSEKSGGFWQSLRHDILAAVSWGQEILHMKGAGSCVLVVSCLLIKSFVEVRGLLPALVPFQRIWLEYQELPATNCLEADLVLNSVVNWKVDLLTISDTCCAESLCPALPKRAAASSKALFTPLAGCGARHEDWEVFCCSTEMVVFLLRCSARGPRQPNNCPVTGCLRPTHCSSGWQWDDGLLVLTGRPVWSPQEADLTARLVDWIMSLQR